MLTHNLIQPHPLHTPIKPKAFRRLIQFLQREILEQARKFHREGLRHEYFHNCSGKMALRVPGSGIRFRGLGTHFIDELCKRINLGGFFRAGILAPGIELQSTFLLEEGLDSSVP